MTTAERPAVDPDDLLEDMDVVVALLVEARAQLRGLLRNVRGASGASFPRDRATDPGPGTCRTAVPGPVLPTLERAAAAASAARDAITEARDACLWAWEPETLAPKPRRRKP